MALTIQRDLDEHNDLERSLYKKLGAIHPAVTEHTGWKKLSCQLAAYFHIATAPVCSHIEVSCYSKSFTVN